MSTESISEAGPASIRRYRESRDVTVPASTITAGLVSGLACLGLVLVAFTPLFVCMPLWVDATHYDICARNLLQGGVHYRDTLDSNFPGVVWMHVAIREMFGWSSEALRAFDLAAFSGIVCLIWRLLTVAGAAGAVRAWAAVAFYGFYFSLPETCHCQRDVWMFFCAMLALSLRQAQLTDPLSGSFQVRLLRSMLEGLLWGAAIWIKPFVIVPAICCWLGGRFATTHRKYAADRVETGFQAAWRSDLIGLLVGGLAAGAAGMFWLWTSGSWPWFVEVMFGWNVEYIDNRHFFLNRSLNWLFWTLRSAPWSFVNLMAIPVSLRMLSALRQRQATPQEIPGVLVASLYLGWLVQANLLQVQHDYVQASTILPGLGVLAIRAATLSLSSSRRVLLLVVLVLAAVQHPLAKSEPISLWARCWQNGSTAEMCDELAQTGGPGSAAWQDLRIIESFLRQNAVQDGQVTCWDDSSAPLFLWLDVKPSNRFIHNYVWTLFYPSRRSAMLAELAASQQKFVVNDLLLAGFTQKQIDARRSEDGDSLSRSLPKQLANQFPWSEPIIYHAGRYVVHAVRQPQAARATEK